MRKDTLWRLPLGDLLKSRPAFKSFVGGENVRMKEMS